MESSSPLKKTLQSDFTNGLPNVQTPAITDIWLRAVNTVQSGLDRGITDRQALAAVAAADAINHPRRCELPGNPLVQVLTAYQAGHEAARHELGREVQE